MAQRARRAAGLVLAAVLAVGCVERTITITSNPSGALVHLNDEEVGRTPVTVPFTFYGTYDVRLEAEGYQTLWTQTRAEAPLWEAPGPDLIAEAVPNAESRFRWHYDLAPVPEAQEDALVDRAKQMRAMLRSPLPPEPRTQAPANAEAPRE